VLPLAGIAACTAPSKGALMLAITTDMQAPKDVDVVSVYVTTDGAPKFNYLGRVLPDGTVTLPSTLAVVEPDQAGAQVRIRVTAFKTNAGGSADAKVLRDVLTTVPHQRVALLSLPLDFVDDGSGSGNLPGMLVPGDAPEGITSFDPTQLTSACDFTNKQQTMIVGVCASAVIDSSTLPTYDPSQVFGDGGPSSCFPADTCFANAMTVAGTQGSSCSFAVPSGVDPATLNVGFVTNATGACLPSGECYVPLPSDPNEGWTVQGGSVELAAGVCAKLGNGIGLAVSTGACPSKTTALPVCQPGETQAGSADGGLDATTQSGDASTLDGSVEGGPGSGCKAACTNGEFCWLGSCTHLTQIAAGWTHTCALTSAGGVQCWGDNGFGQLGTGTQQTSFTPVPVQGLSSGVVAVAASNSFSCALLASGTVDCWGTGGFGQLGTASSVGSPTPVAISGLAPNIMAIAAGGDFVCALAKAGTVQCWGNDAVGELGDGPRDGGNTTSPSPVSVQGLSGVTEITAGDAHACALVSGVVWCWGQGASGQLGNGSTSKSATPVQVKTLTGVTAIAAGTETTCALTGSQMVCWGGNNANEIEQSPNPSPSPVAITALPGTPSAIAMGGKNVCAVIEGGLECWGANVYGQIGNDEIAPAVAFPAAVSNLGTGVAGVSVAVNHSCALLTGGVASCWGFDFEGELGNGGMNGSGPVSVKGLTTGVTGVSAGGGHACAVTSAGAASCWGDNEFGDLGAGATTVTVSTAPQPVSGLSQGVVHVSSGYGHSCATTSNLVECWGYNAYGQLGNGTTTDSSAPVQVTVGGGAPVSVAAGGHFTCALTTANGLKCWGDNSSGQVGNGTIGGQQNAPAPAFGTQLTNVSAVSAGGAFACAMTGVNTQVMCWGDDSEGQLGPNGASYTGASPVQIAGLKASVQAIALGDKHACALETGGIVQCWGANDYGQAGASPTMLTSSTPVTVIASGAVGVGAGGYDSCAVMTDGSVECWGQNYTSSPGAVTGVSNAAQVTVGIGFFCALSKSGGLTCWGDNSYGELGNGATVGVTPLSVVEP
jgi:alpha-tubulin suppressor-like RCC1 family protein